MKKLLMSAAVLLLFALSILILQISCSKSEAGPTSVTQLNKIVYTVNWGTPNIQIWTANYDGSSPTQVPIVLPPNIKIDGNANYYSIKISPDGQTIFFSTYDASVSPTYSTAIYSCSITGANVTEVIPTSAGNPILNGSY